MPNRSSKKKPRDINQLAASIVDEATSEDETTKVDHDQIVDSELGKPQPEKNPHAQALGRLGGLKGGKARAEKLSAERKSEIARRAAEKRWGKRSG